MLVLKNKSVWRGAVLGLLFAFLSACTSSNSRNRHAPPPGSKQPIEFQRTPKPQKKKKSSPPKKKNSSKPKTTANAPAVRKKKTEPAPKIEKIENDDLPPVKPIEMKKGEPGLFDKNGFRVKPPEPKELMPVEPIKVKEKNGNVPGPQDLIDSIKVKENNAYRAIKANGQDVVISGSGGEISIIGGCGKLTVSGGNNLIRCDSVRLIDVTGDKNNLILDKVCCGAIPGNGNKISWKTATDDLVPVIDSSGINNEIVHQE